MKIKFNIDYKTQFGEQMMLNIVSTKEGKRKVSSYHMTTVNGETWTYELNGRYAVGQVLDYYYSVKTSDTERMEWQVTIHRLEMVSEKGTRYVVYDRWIETPEDSYLYSSAFTECIARHTPVKSPLKPFAKTVRLKVRAPQLRTNERLALVGAGRALGNWDIRKALPMTEHNYNEWMVNIDASQITDEKLEFKFICVNEDNNIDIQWETGYNREIVMAAINDGEVIVYELPIANFDFPRQRCAGTLVPVFSLRSKDSFGVGDFGDLVKMIDWVGATGQRVLQILPINDTTITHTWTDSYPYSCISIFALHPQYADLKALPELKDEKKRKEFEALRQELNALPQIDYERVNNAKMEYLRLIFKQEGARMMKTVAYKRFFEESKEWLEPYAKYCCKRDGLKEDSVPFFYFVQYVLSRQMSEAHEHARQKGIILKGDIPIGVNRQGCDVWQEPRYFNLNGQAGAPPDDFSVNGQNWGFPTYNWDEMIKDDCRWWIRRFQNMSKYFDAYRIDHVLGFFRIWEIPADAVHGLLGQFAPALGMSREEIESYGLHFQEELFTRPFITDWVLDRIFREHTAEVKKKYLNEEKNGFYSMKPEYDTQRKVEKAFEGKNTDKDIWLRDGLYALISDVLFVRDHRDPNKFHPRISVQFDFIYESLYDSDKFVFNKLYNDYFYRRNNQYWYTEAMKKLPRLVEATRMLVCAEDLGMVPDCVAWVMDQLRILSLEIQSMPKDPTVRFGHLSRNPYRSVCTISSHDMPTLRQWWDEDESRTQDYYSTMLHRDGAAPHPLPGWLARDIVSRQLTSPSMLCILSIQDWMAIDETLRLADADAERINIPANPKHYWRYRMHVSIEDLMANTSFTENVKELVIQSGRK
ncbi:MAG: 4-alpha-glucanotransferase [Prevotella sp.]|nr:4-alpha-glucanotransferase [Prevotella sp.]MBQ9651100.1 4-alpha-glucanotransferase [Prevotella sp.]